MIYFHNKKHLFVNLLSPPEGVPETVTTASDLDNILNNVTAEDYGRVYYYTGPTTDEYTQYTYYMIKPEVTIITQKTCAPFEVYESDGTQPIGERLLRLPNEELLNITKHTIECNSGYLYFKVADDYDKQFESTKIQNGELTLVADENDYKIFKVETDGEVEVLTERTVEPQTGPPYIVTINGLSNACGKFSVYDIDDPLKASSKNKVAVLCGGDGRFFKVAVSCKTGYLYFELDETDAGQWIKFGSTSGDIYIVKSNSKSYFVKINSKSTIEACANTIRGEPITGIQPGEITGKTEKVVSIALLPYLQELTYDDFTVYDGYDNTGEVIDYIIDKTTDLWNWNYISKTGTICIELKEGLEFNLMYTGILFGTVVPRYIGLTTMVYEIVSDTVKLQLYLDKTSETS